jgi:hypothetical protein
MGIDRMKRYIMSETFWCYEIDFGSRGYLWRCIW